MTSQTVVYTASATIFAILFGELILPASVGNSLPILSNPVTFVAMTFYYVTISFLFSKILGKYGTKMALTAFFVYGGIAELILFGNVGDVVGFVFFGCLYIFLFGVPIRITKKLTVKVHHSET